jgi:hypothetical protein
LKDSSQSPLSLEKLGGKGSSRVPASGSTSSSSSSGSTSRFLE